jgi:hypothetical protein
MPAITNMVTEQISEVTSDKFYIAGDCNTGKYV